MWDRLFSATSVLQKGLDASWQRSGVIADNLANVDTPGFKASKVEFEATLAKALRDSSDFSAKKTRSGHIDFAGADLDNVRAQVTTPWNSSMRMDENNVDAEKEMAELARNSIYYYTLTTKVNKELSRIKLAITSK